MVDHLTNRRSKPRRAKAKAFRPAKTKSKDYTVRDLEEILARYKKKKTEKGAVTYKAVFQQLLDTMKREEQLKADMKYIARPALGGKFQQYHAQNVLKQLYPNEYSGDAK